MYLGWPQITYILIVVVGMLYAAHSHGREERQNFWHSVIGTGIVVAILVWGGFFAQPPQ